jgi:hypothetical protein
LKRFGLGRLAITFAAPADQAITSVSNILISVVVARSEDLREFALFSTFWLAHVLFLVVVRGMHGEVLQVVSARTPDSAVARQDSAVSVAQFALAVSTSYLTASLFLGGSLRVYALLFALVTPFVFLQDHFRYTCFARLCIRDALHSDVAFLAIQVGSLVGFFAIWGHVTPAAAIFTWGLGAMITLTARGPRAMLQCRLRSQWLIDWRFLASRFTVEALIMRGSSHLALIGVGLVASVDALGAIRGAALIFGPASVLLAGVLAIGIPRAAREGSSFAKSDHTIRATFWFLLAVVAYALALSLPTGGIGPSMLGDSWRVTQPLIVPYAVLVFCTGLQLPASVRLRSEGHANESLKARGILAALRLGAAPTGVHWGSASGAVWGLVLAEAIGTTALWRQALRATRASGRHP